MLNIANRPMTTAEYPTFANESEGIQRELSLVARYNNAHKGIIDTEFIQWALDNSISYHIAHWFICVFFGRR